MPSAGTGRSKTHQQVILGQGLAVGVLLVGCDSLRGSTMDVEFAFRHAWRRWPNARRFPTIQAGPARDDIVRSVMGRSQRRAGSIVTAWFVDGPDHVPYVAMEGWSIELAVEQIVETSGIAAESWIHLAQLTIDCLDERSRPTS